VLHPPYFKRLFNRRTSAARGGRQRKTNGHKLDLLCKTALAAGLGLLRRRPLAVFFSEAAPHNLEKELIPPILSTASHTAAPRLMPSGLAGESFLIKLTRFAC
jgi:hypothetical protein